MRKIKFISLIAFVVSILMFSSCQKESLEDTLNTSELSTENENDISEEEFWREVFAEAQNDGTSRDLSAYSIPSKFYRVYSKYKNAYQHIKQKTNECSWTSYVLAAGAIAKGKGNGYNVSSSKITTVKNWCRNQEGCSGNYYGTCGSFIGTLKNFGNTYDKPVITSKLKVQSTSNRIYMVRDMLNHIDNHHTPFLALGERNGIGHYFIIWSIDWKQGGVGSRVWYTDPLESNKGNFNANVKSMSLTTLLNSMRDNPSANYLNILSTY